jgi:hypothetical protein
MFRAVPYFLRFEAESAYLLCLIYKRAQVKLFCQTILEKQHQTSILNKQQKFQKVGTS